MKTIAELHDLEMKLLANKHESQTKREKFVFLVIGIILSIALAL
jgi:hypothetical protein